MTSDNKKEQLLLLIEKFNKLNYYRQPKPKTHKQLQIVFQNIALEHQVNHYGIALFATIGLNPNQPMTIQEEWNLFVKTMPQIISVIDQNYVISGIVLGIELYQKNKQRPNSKSFKPHVHMVIFAVNEFMAAPIFKLSKELIQLGLDVKVDPLKKPSDVANAMRYTIKSASDPLTRQATFAFLGAEPTMVYINTAINENPLLNLETFIHKPTIPLVIHKKELFWKVPSVARHNDTKYSAAEFLAKLCQQQRIGFYNDMLLKRKSGSHFTWEKWKPVNQFIDALAKEKLMPPGYKQFFLDNAAWIIKEGATASTQPIHTVFPRVEIAPHLWEFRWGFVYNFNTDECLPREATEFLSCSQFVDMAFDKLKKPTRLLKLINILAGGKAQAFKLLKSLGGLFHRLTASRKKHKALWVYGDNNTFKTWLIASFLEKCFHELLVTTIPQSASTFQWSQIRNTEYGVIFIDDFRSPNFKANIPVLINVVDGRATNIEEKHKPGETINYKGHMAITSNESIEDTHFRDMDKRALQERFCEVQFSYNKLVPPKLDFSDQEWAALAIFANKCFLNKKNRV